MRRYELSFVYSFQTQIVTQHIYESMISYKLNNVENLRRINSNSHFYLMLVHI
jgi:hypothetical protein